VLFVGARRSGEERDGGAFVDNIRQGRPLACDTLGGFDTGSLLMSSMTSQGC